MQISYDLTEKDFVEAYGVHRNRTAFSKWTRRLFVGTFSVIAALVLFGFLLKPTAQAAKNLMPFFGLVILWVVTLCFYPRWTMRRQFRKQPGAHGGRTLLLDGLGAHWRWNGGSGDIEWRNYIRWLEGKNQFLFYTSPACFNILPKHRLAPEQISELRELLRQNIQSAR